MTMVRSLSVSVAVLALLLVSAARAAATTWTVDPTHSGACDTTADVCPTINSAIAAAAASDEIDIKPGTYTETVNVSKDGLILKGLSSGTGGVALKPGASGAPLTLSGNGDTIESMLVFDAANHGGAIQVTGTGGTVSDAIVLATAEPTVIFNNKGTDVIQRSTLISNGANTVELHAANGATPTLTIDSTIAAGTGGSASVFAESDGVANLLGGGTATINARHLTAVGQTDGLLANAPVLLGGTAAITADNSIVHGTTAPTAATAGGPLDHASATTTHSDTTSADSDLFVNPAQFDFHLKKGAAVINQGNDSPTNAEDVDGQSRVIGTASDLGADEYDDLTNTTPTLTATPATAAAGQAVAFQAAAAPDAATTNGVDHFVINYGDGSAQASTATGAASHAYAAAGTYHATVVAVGKSGAVSPAGTVAVTVGSSSGGGGGGGGGGGTGGGGNATGACTGGFSQPNGSPTTLVISPRNNGVLRLKKTVTKKVRRHGKTRRIKVKVFNPPTVSGVVCDSDGVGSVKIAVLYLGASKKLPSTGTCKAFNGTTSFTSVSCASTPFFSTRLTDFNWRFKFSKKAKLKTGYYAVFVKATDLKGNTSSTLSPAAGTVSVFREK